LHKINKSYSTYLIHLWSNKLFGNYLILFFLKLSATLEEVWGQGRAVSGLFPCPFPATSHCCQGYNDPNFKKKKVVQKRVLNHFFFSKFFFQGGTISATLAGYSLRVFVGTTMFKGIGNPRASNALKPHLMSFK